MIKKFNDFSINELKTNTYRSASQKLKSLSHEKRGEDLERWSRMRDTRDFGLFNLGFEIREFEVRSRRDGGMKWEKSNVPLSYLNKKLSGDKKSLLDGSRLVKGSPNSCHVSFCLLDGIEEMYSTPRECTHLGLAFGFIPEESNGVIYPFYLCVDLEWDDEDMFVVKDSSAWIDDTANDFEGIFFFSDRKSAVNFKKLLTEDNIRRLGEIDEVRDFFVNNAKDSKQWSKFFTTLQSINTNKIYR